MAPRAFHPRTFCKFCMLGFCSYAPLLHSLGISIQAYCNIHTYICILYLIIPLFLGYENNSMYPKVLGIPPSAGVMQDAAFLNMVKSKREYEEANMGMGMGQHMSAPISDGNTKSWQKHI